jgi:hypothetical protein
MDDLIFQVVEVGIIEVISTLNGPIGHSSLTLEYLNDLSENLIEGHTCPFRSLGFPSL